MDEQPASNATPLTYEETPVIQPDPKPVGPPAPVAPPTPPPPTKRTGTKILGAVGTFVVFLLLFAGGVWMSGIIRGYLANETGPEATPTPSPLPVVEVSSPIATSSSQGASPTAWVTYSVISGVTRQAVPGITFQLPPTVVPPSCDGESCASQGTYLPGGTRFTIAARGEGQIFKDFRGSIISDLQGQAFTVGEVTVASRRAIEFQGVFNGATANGGVFDQMHGMMIEVTDTLSLEINHFTPTGVVANFTQDDILFADIVASIKLP